MMQVAIVQQGTIPVIKVAGRMVLVESKGLENLARKVGELLASNQKEIVLDVSEVPHIDSSGLGKIVAIWDSIHKAKGRLGLVVNSTQATGVFAVTKLNSLFEMYDNSESAVSAFTS